jgi:Fe-S-cluster containining protein
MADTEREVKVWFCTGCGNCCRWPGDVRVLDDDVAAMAGYLELDERTFVERYTRLHSDRRGLSLVNRERDEGCVFLTDDDRCAVHAVKPRQCRDYPNRWNQEGFERDCAALSLRTRLRAVAATTPTAYPPPAEA